MNHKREHLPWVHNSTHHRRAPRGLGRIGSALTLLAFIGLASGCKKAEGPLPAPPGVEVVTVEQKDLPICRDWVGTLESEVNATNAYAGSYRIFNDRRINGVTSKLETDQAVAARTPSVKLATERYPNGKSSYFEMLQAQQELYPTQRSRIQTQASELLSVVQLYKALGGGWQAPASR